MLRRRRHGGEVVVVGGRIVPRRGGGAPSNWRRSLLRLGLPIAVATALSWGTSHRRRRPIGATTATPSDTTDFGFLLTSKCSNTNNRDKGGGDGSRGSAIELRFLGVIDLTVCRGNHDANNSNDGSSRSASSSPPSSLRWWPSTGVRGRRGQYRDELCRFGRHMLCRRRDYFYYDGGGSPSTTSTTVDPVGCAFRTHRILCYLIWLAAFVQFCDFPPLVPVDRAVDNIFSALVGVPLLPNDSTILNPWWLRWAILAVAFETCFLSPVWRVLATTIQHQQQQTSPFAYLRSFQLNYWANFALLWTITNLLVRNLTCNEYRRRYRSSPSTSFRDVIRTLQLQFAAGLGYVRGANNDKNAMFYLFDYSEFAVPIITLTWTSFLVGLATECMGGRRRSRGSGGDGDPLQFVVGWFIVNFAASLLGNRQYHYLQPYYKHEATVRSVWTGTINYLSQLFGG